ncbi:hypothetical protein RND81_14G143900 [Saponaria officinalis]|uniref:Uncharacterized protein n=1 Tax=Saponaria officinalis TaxID=3572 RepID=A0AAW1GPX1_SAPOF
MSQGRKRSQADMPTVMSNKYEQQRLLNIQANKRRLESFNIKHIGASLSSFVNSTMEKKRKGKKRSIIDEDEDYEPNVDEDDEILGKASEINTKLDAAKKVNNKLVVVKTMKTLITMKISTMRNLIVLWRCKEI